MAVRAIVFDLDGTIADTEELHFEAFNAVLSHYAIEISRADYFSRLIGYDDRDCLTLMLREHGKPADAAKIAKLIAQKTAVYQATIAQRQVLFAGAAAFVRRCAARFPLAMVTGALRAEAELILRRAQLQDLFAAIVAAEEVEHGKPAPDGFNAALERLAEVIRPRPALVPEQCMVVEDTPAGIEAARRAGMHVLAVAQTVPASQLAAADLIRPSLAEADLDEVLQLLGVRG
jgi:beta-phosphoglucomutase